MVFREVYSTERVMDVITGGLIGFFITLGIFVALIFLFAFYIYFALAWSTIARKLKYKKDWLAWIPIANGAMILQLGGFHWAWIFLILIPIFGWIALFVLLIIATWRIFEKRKYPGLFSLSIVIPKVGGILYLVAIGIVAWSENKGGSYRIKQIKKRKTVSKKKR